MSNQSQIFEKDLQWQLTLIQLKLPLPLLVAHASHDIAFSYLSQLFLIIITRQMKEAISCINHYKTKLRICLRNY